jgi:DNA invertase Pin-like site-specific DNA recombinase
MRAAIYARVSTREGQEPENQLSELRRYAAAQGWSVIGEYVDRDSGSSLERPHFQTMLEAARRRRFDVLLFWSLDRLSREGATRTLTLLNRLESWGVRFRSLQEEYLDSCGLFREAVISILAVIARQERVRISERTRAGLQTARNKGKKIGRPRKLFDIEAAKELVKAGKAWEVPEILGISVSTLRRRLKGQAKTQIKTDTPTNASAPSSSGSTVPISGRVIAGRPDPLPNDSSGTSTGIPTCPAT